MPIVVKYPSVANLAKAPARFPRVPRLQDSIALGAPSHLSNFLSPTLPDTY
jgi:hypothetical protein